MEELPDVVKLFDESFNIEFKFNSQGLLSHEKFYLDVMKDIVCRNVGLTDSNCYTGFLLWVSDITIAVIVKK